MADSLNSRDIDMIFRAETVGATRNIGELKKSVRDLRQELTNQIAAANKGEASLDDLAQTVRNLKQAQDELGTARGLLTSLNTLTGQQDRAVAKTEQLRTELAALQAQAAATAAPLKSLTNAISRKERALAAAEGREQELSTTLAEQRQQIESIIGPVSNLRDSFETIARASKDVAQGLAISGNAAVDFEQKIKQAAATRASLDDFQQFGESAGLMQQDIDFLAQFEDRIERVTAARNEQVAADLRFQDVLQSNIATQQRLEQTNAFRQTAESAREAFRDVSRFKDATESSETSVRRLASAVADLANPARAASRDLEQVAVKVDEIADRTEKGQKSVRLGALSDDLNNLEQALASLQRQAGIVDGLRAQETAAAAAEAQFESAKAEVFQLANALDQAGADGAENATALRQAETAAEAAGVAWQRETTKLRQLGEAAEAAGLDIRNLDAVEKQIITTSTRAGAAAEKLRRHLGTGRGGPGSGFLGLRPHELQNLGFQINDVFVGLVSGQRPLTVLFQQGSQISQIFPGMWAAVAKGLPILAPLVILFGLLAAGMSRAARNAKELREISAALVELGEGGKFTQEGVKDSIDALDDLGASAEDAKKAVLSFVKDGLDPKFVDDFAAASQNLAEITGDELPEAAKKVLDAFTQGKDAVLALDDEFRFLTDTERKHIRSMSDSKDAAEIRTIAFDAFFKKAQEVAAELEGPSTRASITLANAWDNLLDTLAISSPYESILGWFDDIKVGIARLINFVAAGIKVLKNSFGALAVGFTSGGIGGFLNALTKVGGVALAEGDVETRKQLFGTGGGRGGARTSKGDPGAGTRGARGLREDLADKANRKTGKSEAQKRAEEIERETEQLTRALEAMTSKALVLQNQTIEEQLGSAREAIESEYAKLFRQLDEFGAKFGANVKIGDLTQEQFRAQLEANKKLIVQQAQLKVFEEGINDLLNERKQRLEQIEERQNAGLITAEQAFENSLAVAEELNPRIEKVARDAEAFALAIGGANPSPALREFLAKIDGVGITLTETQSDIQSAGLANLNELEEKRNEVIQRRDALIAANNELTRLGLLTRKDAQDQAESAYAREAIAIQEVIVKEQALLRVLLARGAISQTEFDSRMANLQAIGAQLDYLDPRFVQLKQSIDQIITQEVVTFIDAFAQSVANIVTNSEDAVDALGDLGLAFLNMISQMLQLIARLIIQMLILDAIQKLTGIPVAALLRLQGGGGGGGGSGGSPGFFHGGGRVGGPSQMRRSNFRIDPTMLSSVPRYHEGTQGAGLKRDEMLAVLRRGEKVVTEEQDRLAAKRGQGGGGARLRQVFAFGDDEIAGAMAGRAGEEVTLTHIRRNSPRIRQELGIDN